ncbi:hypothetical protein ABG768_003109, partial [Culter alburnus]
MKCIDWLCATIKLKKGPNSVSSNCECKGHSRKRGTKLSLTNPKASGQLWEKSLSLNYFHGRIA